MKPEYRKQYRMLGQNIRFYRKQCNMTQQALGEAIGTDKQQIGRIERAERGVALDRLLDIVKALGLDGVHVLFIPHAKPDDDE